MAKRKSAKDLETPECDAPDQWSDIDASIWQGQKGRWAAPQHYMCSYMAMFPPELPHYFIERFTKPGDTVLDPFSGRGTAPVEAAAQGRHGIGNDLNPLAVALTRGKLSNPEIDPVIERIDELEAQYDPSEWSVDEEPDRIRMIYHENTLRQLVFLRDRLDWDAPGVDAFIVTVLMGAMHGGSKGFLSLPMPNTFSMSWNYISRKVREEPEKFACPDRDAFEILRTRVRRQLSKGRLPGSGEAIYGDVRDLDKNVDHGSVQLLFTSPPYLKVIKYGLYNWIRLWFLTESGSHEEVDEALDDTHAISEYLDFMRDTLTATLPLIDPERGLSCWAIGDVKGLNLAWAVWYHAARRVEIEADDGSILRYKLVAIVEDKIPEEQKVTKIWKTLLHRAVRVNHDGEIIEIIGESNDEEEAKKMASEAEIVDGMAVEIRSVATNDKSGKATQVDRILIMAPESSNPVPLVENPDLEWNPIRPAVKPPKTPVIRSLTELLESDSWNGKLVISPDIDGLVTANLISHLFDAELIGFYEVGAESRILLSEGNEWKDAESALWLDHDILDNRIISVGQHMIHPFSNSVNGVDGFEDRNGNFDFDRTSPFQRNPLSINPHDFGRFGWDKPATFPRCPEEGCEGYAFPMGGYCKKHGGNWTKGSWKNEGLGFRRKYPFATIHLFLAALRGYDIHFSENAMMMIAHSDSAWLAANQNAKNAEWWSENVLDSEPNSAALAGEEPLHVGNRETMLKHLNLIWLLDDEEVIDLMTDRREQRESKIRELSIYSAGFSKGNKQRLNGKWIENGKLDKLASITANITGWNFKASDGPLHTVGSGKTGKIWNPKSDPWSGDFGSWLRENNVFSLAFTSMDGFRFTTDMEIV